MATAADLAPADSLFRALTISGSVASSLAIRSVSAARSGDVTGTELGLGQGAELGLELGNLGPHLLERGGRGALAFGERGGDLGVEPLLGLGDLLGDGGGSGDRAAFAGGLGQGLQRGLQLSDAVGKPGKLGRHLLDVRFEAGELCLERRERLGVDEAGGAASSLASRCSSAAMSGAGFAPWPRSSPLQA